LGGGGAEGGGQLFWAGGAIDGLLGAGDDFAVGADALGDDAFGGDAHRQGQAHVFGE
jgi:hypothetical protein